MSTHSETKKNRFSQDKALILFNIFTQQQEQLDELEASGTRRSVRQRRQLYGTLNEKQLDSVHGPEASFAESIQRRKRRRLDVEEEEGHEEDEKQEEEEPGEDGVG